MRRAAVCACGEGGGRGMQTYGRCRAACRRYAWDGAGYECQKCRQCDDPENKCSECTSDDPEEVCSWGSLRGRFGDSFKKSGKGLENMVRWLFGRVDGLGGDRCILAHGSATSTHRPKGR